LLVSNLPPAPKKKNNNKKKKAVKTKSNGDLREQDAETNPPAENGDEEVDVEESGQSAAVRVTPVQLSKRCRF
jgi:hypothetical protein